MQLSVSVSVGRSPLDALSQIFRIRHKQIITGRLTLIAKAFRQLCLAVPIALIETIFYGVNGIPLDK
jgi:hypothetical protein